MAYTNVSKSSDTPKKKPTEHKSCIRSEYNNKQTMYIKRQTAATVAVAVTNY